MSLALQLPEATIAWVPTVAQIAYACGLLLLMPLGDIVEKRKLLLILMLLAASGLLLSGFSSHIALIIIGTVITGLFSVSAQLLLPLAASLVPMHHSGRVVGLFGLVGIIDTFIANFAGRYIDRGYIHRISMSCGFGLILSWLLFLLLPLHFIFYILGSILIYASLSAVHVTNQSIVFKLNQQLKSRFNAIYRPVIFWVAHLAP
ncbi:MFS transporter [Acinetobacter calcoaceticus]|uniref:MFS transporter n=1 Tax=Acinetobacter calcoaceticus TaxID=471 RepID=A0A4R1XYP6_ACICA|nr:MFS transporter [Acinetobacter calcoaceticus]